MGERVADADADCSGGSGGSVAIDVAVVDEEALTTTPCFRALFICGPAAPYSLLPPPPCW